ncbi:MAG: type II secretion system F family protein [Planctomycetes bacterium]|nr:type II secretion system F family protein [Planctomycetota bacterium]
MIEPNVEAAKELRLWSQGEEHTTLVSDNKKKKTSLAESVENWRQKARIKVPVSSIILGTVGMCSGAFALTFVMTHSFFASFGVDAVIAIVLWGYLKQLESKGTTLFEMQFIDALDLASRSLRAGHPLTGAFQLAGEEISAPVGTIFKEIGQQQDLGLSLEESLRRASLAHDSADLKLFATSVVIQLESGGNLADMMDRLTGVIRDRLRLARHARVLTAQTQLSKRILLALPFFLFVVLNVVNPGYMEPLIRSSEGRYLIAFGVVSLLVGMWVMNRMVRLKY